LIRFDHSGLRIRGCNTDAQQHAQDESSFLQRNSPRFRRVSSRDWPGQCTRVRASAKEAAKGENGSVITAVQSVL
jgi:hypothetical protein